MNATFVRLLASESRKEVAAVVGVSYASNSSALHIEISADSMYAPTRTDGDAEVLDGVGFPLFMLGSVEAQLREHVRRYECLEVRL